MWEFSYPEEYLSCVSDLLADGAVQAMRLLPQHRAGVSCYHHSVLVSRLSWRVCRRLTWSSVSSMTTVHRPPSLCTSAMWRVDTRVERWIRTNPASAHRSSRVARGMRTRWEPVGVWRRA